MIMKPVSIALLGLAVSCGFMALSNAATPVALPRIEHAPVAVSVRGQDILFRARATPGTNPIRSVTLFYAVSRDAAPFKVAMQESGAGWYTGSVSGELTSGLSQLLYYLEARDAADAVAETPWHTITVKNPAASGNAGIRPSPPPSGETGSSWKKPALIAGGVLLAGGAALALTSGGGGGGGGSDNTYTNPGTYNGTVTLCIQPPGSSSSCTTRSMTLVIDQNGMVSSDTLHEGQHLESQLSGANFLMVASITETNGSGQVQYLGTLVNNRIYGSIQGTLTSSTGTGTYSGNFSAAK